jgi:hypothetical protein
MNFEEEALTSYAHLDNQKLIEGRKGWVSDFHRAPKIRLGELLGKDPRIWRDPKLQGNDGFPDTLSEFYVAGREHGEKRGAFFKLFSEWTRRELADFCAAARKTTGIFFADKARIFKILKTPVPLEDVVDAPNTHIANPKIGPRIFFNAHDSLYAGYSRQITHIGWRRDLLRVEYRHTF